MFFFCFRLLPSCPSPSSFLLLLSFLPLLFLFSFILPFFLSLHFFFFFFVFVLFVRFFFVLFFCSTFRIQDMHLISVNSNGSLFLFGMLMVILSLGLTILTGLFFFGFPN